MGLLVRTLQAWAGLGAAGQGFGLASGPSSTGGPHLSPPGTRRGLSHGSVWRGHAQGVAPPSRASEAEEGRWESPPRRQEVHTAPPEGGRGDLELTGSEHFPCQHPRDAGGSLKIYSPTPMNVNFW